MLEQMANLVHKEKPDAFLLSGDVFHTDQPSAAVQRMLAFMPMRAFPAQGRTNARNSSACWPMPW